MPDRERMTRAQRVTVERDDEHGLIYVYLQPDRDRDGVVAFSDPVSPNIIVDYCADGTIFGIEIIQ